MFITRDKDGTIQVHQKKPFRTTINGWDSRGKTANLSESAASVILGFDLTWDDEPIEIQKV